MMIRAKMKVKCFRNIFAQYVGCLCRIATMGVGPNNGTNEELFFSAVSKSEGYPADGSDENNTYAKWNRRIKNDDNQSGFIRQVFSRARVLC